MVSNFKIDLMFMTLYAFMSLECNIKVSIFHPRDLYLIIEVGVSFFKHEESYENLYKYILVEESSYEAEGENDLGQQSNDEKNKENKQEK
jgi:hypothetical protein